MREEDYNWLQQLKKKKGVPFDFVLDRLVTLRPALKPMFGCHAVYVGNKIIFILRDKKTFPQDNGVWVATEFNHHASLRKQFPSLRSIAVFGTGETAWQVVPATEPNFESVVESLCECVHKADERIGRVPAKRTKKTSTSRTPPQKLRKKKTLYWADLQGVTD